MFFKGKMGFRKGKGLELGERDFLQGEMTSKSGNREFRKGNVFIRILVINDEPYDAFHNL